MRKSLFLYITFLLNLSCFAQTNVKLDKIIDSNFKSFNNTTPGVAITVLQNGKPIVKKNLWSCKPGV
jgi:hypothetical protein